MNDKQMHTVLSADITLQKLILFLKNNVDKKAKLYPSLDSSAIPLNFGSISVRFKSKDVIVNYSIQSAEIISLNYPEFVTKDNRDQLVVLTDDSEFMNFIIDKFKSECDLYFNFQTEL